MAKSDSSEMEKRINTIYAMLLQGIQRKTIIQYCTKTYEISERQVDTYLKQARELMTDESYKDLELKKSEILAQYYDLYHKSYKALDFKECRNILGNIDNILGISAPKKIDNNISVNTFDLKDILNFKND
jgi:hypothetical protein